MASLLSTMPLARAEVRLSEWVASTSQRLLERDDQGRFRPGTGPHWPDAGFAESGWRRGAAPLGFGGSAGLRTNVATLLRHRTPGLYLRRIFNLTPAEAENPGRLTLRLVFDDGFIVYLNGREAGRANAGPPGHFVAHDQPAYNFASATNDSRYDPRQQQGTAGAQPMTLDLGPAVNWLHAGENVLAVHVLNREPDVSIRLDAQLEVVPGDASLPMLSDSFDDANGATARVRWRGGVAEFEADGEPPPGSWMARSPTPLAPPASPDFSLISSLSEWVGVGGTGALKVQFEPGGLGSTATWFGPPAVVPASLPGGILSESTLPNATVKFRFRTTPDSAHAFRLEPTPGDSTRALTGLLPVTSTSGVAAIETPPDEFSDAVGGLRTLSVDEMGTVSGGTLGTIRNSFTLGVGPAMRDFDFRVTEDPAAGAGSTPGHLRCEVTRAAAAPDFFGFTLQTFQLRSWTAGSITPDQLAAVKLILDARLPADTPLRLWLEPATARSGAAHRLDLGEVTGTGHWQRHELDPATGINQAAFLTEMNAKRTTLVRVAFRSEQPLPVGTAWQIDSIGFVPWRTYTATLAAGSNATAFLEAVNALTPPRFYPAWTTTVSGPSSAPQELVIDDFALQLTLPDAGTPQVLVPWGASDWAYWPGLAEPSGGLVETADFSDPTADPDFADWIELENTGSEEADLTGWALTNRADVPQQWIFPPGTRVAAGGRLVVLASGRSAPPTGADWLHANFTLSAEGGHLALVDATGRVRDGFIPAYAPQGPFYSFGRNAEGVWGFMRDATPGQANAGPWSDRRAEPVEWAPPGGFHAGTVTVTLATVTPGTSIRYTLDGSEPTPSNGFDYDGPLRLSAINDRTGHTVRARAFAQGALPSPVTTQTYLIDQHPHLRSAPAIVLSGDAGNVFYLPNGVMAIQGGSYVDELWTAEGLADYNIPMAHGRMLDPWAPQRPYERLVNLQVLPPDDRPSLNLGAGLRVASSPYSRPRLRLDQAASASPLPADATQKPSFNLFFRGDYGASSITHPLIPETAVRRFEELRLRAGKNDISNPFIRDEFVRRLFTDLGQVGSVGSFNGLWINGAYKGYYNLCERIRTPFLSNHHPGGSGEWDVNYIFQFEEGDTDHFANFLDSRLHADLTLRANYDALAEVLDLTNMADYYLLMVYTAMWDWPDNNWAMARERSERGKWRCYVWDAEGSFGLHGYKPATWNSLSQDLLTEPFWISHLFRRLMTSPEWRLLFADRLQRHFFNGGALTDARLTSRKIQTAAEVAPFLAYAGLTPDDSWFMNWLSPTLGRRRHLFPESLPDQAGYRPGHFRDPDGNGQLADTLWPVTLAPAIGLPPGAVPPGSSLSLALPPGVPSGSQIYYTLDGGDPREWGGGIAEWAAAYAEPIPLAASSVTVRARVRHAMTGEWSPLVEATYRVGVLPAAPGWLVVSELMYHPPPPTPEELSAGFDDADHFEFLALKNIGASPLDLAGLRFSEGISFDFADAGLRVVQPGGQVLLARNRTALTQRYGAAIGDRIVGEFSGGLSNGGERLRLESMADGATIQDFRFGDGDGWPVATDGGGASLILLHPESNPDHTPPENWVASATWGGQPAGNPVALNYDEWGRRAFPMALWDNPVLSTPEADADGDGWSNILEFVLVGAPLDPHRTPTVTSRLIPSESGGYQWELATRMYPSLRGVRVHPESTSRLTETEWALDFQTVSDAVQPDGSILRSWSRPAPIPLTNRYGRLRVEAVAADPE
ncbi:MAG: lamin tail domain-containing protein [Verrucomicrobiales bacterium]